MGQGTGCCLLGLLCIICPFFTGIMGAFVLGGWIWGTVAIIYTGFAFWMCSVVKNDTAKLVVYIILMIPFYILSIPWKQFQ